ncbi:MAG: hypothetical protein EBX36_07630, partial [Planctomycetia bacterium]|nr:hypothetical protein [Planctomycetia bacterium]
RGRLAQVLLDFLDELVLDVTEAERFRDDKPRGNVLRLMTLHAAKGLEFDQVWMVGLEEGLLPHRRAVEAGLDGIAEERRLCYVGVTRARQRLALSLCLTSLGAGLMVWGLHRQFPISSFSAATSNSSTVLEKVVWAFTLYLFFHVFFLDNIVWLVSYWVSSSSS